MADLIRSPLIVNRRVAPELTIPFVAGNIALALLTSPAPPVAQSFIPPIARPQVYADTSQSSFALQRAPVAVGSPVVPTTQIVPARYRIFADTSQNAFAAQHTSVVVGAPFANTFLSAPPARWTNADSSWGTPKVLYSDATFSFKNVPHTAPDRVRPVFDTSKGAFLTLQPLAPKPFFNAPITLLDMFHVTPIDTTQQTSLARGIPAPAATISVLQPYITVYFWKRVA
jgi:hypothetical protein